MPRSRPTRSATARSSSRPTDSPAALPSDGMKRNAPVPKHQHVTISATCLRCMSPQLHEADDFVPAQAGRPSERRGTAKAAREELRLALPERQRGGGRLGFGYADHGVGSSLPFPPSEIGSATAIPSPRDVRGLRTDNPGRISSNPGVGFPPNTRLTFVGR